MPALGLWAEADLASSVCCTAQRPRAGIFRHIQSITYKYRPPRDTRRRLYQTRVSTKQTLCGSGVLYQGGERCCRGKNPKMWLFDRCCFYINNRVFSQFLCTILHEILQIPLVLSNCNLHMERIAHFYKFKSNFCVFAYFKKPCHYCVSLNKSHTFLKNTHLIFGRTAVGLYYQLQMKWCLMLFSEYILRNVLV